MRLNDIYFTDEKLDGIPIPPGQTPPLEFSQGEDVLFEVYLNYNGKIVLPEAWNINAIVKKNAYATTAAWTGIYGNGIYRTDVPGFYKIIIPSETTSFLFAGTYWLDVILQQKVGSGNNEKDINVIILNQPFSIDYAVGSPNPPSVLKTLGSQEQTYPPPIDTTKI